MSFSRSEKTRRHALSLQSFLKYSIQSSTFVSLVVMLCILGALEALVRAGIISGLFVPQPSEIITILYRDSAILGSALVYTLTIALGGFVIALLLAFWLALLMHWFLPIKRLLNPCIILSQTIPTIAIAPLYVLWFGYTSLPKLIIVVSVCFFPIVQNLSDGFLSSHKDRLLLLRSMGANRWQCFWHVELPGSFNTLFAGLKISATYCVMGAIIAEWLGGDKGLGAYMIRAKRAYAYDNMFAAIILVIVASACLVAAIQFIRSKLNHHRPFS